MAKLVTVGDLIAPYPEMICKGSTDQSISMLALDSREVVAGSLFCAIRGSVTDGHRFIEQAIAAGAQSILCEEIETIHPHVQYIVVEDSAKAMSLLAAEFFGHPAKTMKVVGITGTNGKTTCVSILHQLFSQLGETCGLIATSGNKIGTRVLKATHTTPDSISLQRLFREMVDAGCTSCFMEVSSHALAQKRVFGVPFSVAGFTNISRDHLDYHGSMKEYIYSKKLLFDHLSKESIAIVNTDDKQGRIMLQNTEAKAVRYSLYGSGEYTLKIKEQHFDGVAVTVEGQDVFIPLTGKYNMYNCLLAYTVAKELGYSSVDILVGLSGIRDIEGRFQRVPNPRGLVIIVDYAHTPDALENILKTIVDIKSATQKIYTVVGCGGDRDKGKRPQMASIAVEYSDRSIFTSDNPRTEDPYKILEDMEVGVPSDRVSAYIVVENRKHAIKSAVLMANPKDIVLIAGKGHETYQDIDGVKHKFDDRIIASQYAELKEQ